jgi:hypothetical protein
MIPEHVAAGVLARQDPGEKFDDSVADRAFFNKGMGKSIAEMWEAMGLYFRPAQDDRTQGWQQVVSRLRGNQDKPTLYFMENCVDTIRCLPVMQHDETKPEDIDTDLEDHCIDELRYACMSRVAFRSLPTVKPKTETMSSIDPDYQSFGLSR